MFRVVIIGLTGALIVACGARESEDKLVASDIDTRDTGLQRAQDTAAAEEPATWPELLSQTGLYVDLPSGQVANRSVSTTWRGHFGVTAPRSNGCCGYPLVK